MAVLSRIIVGACALVQLAQAAPMVLTITDFVTVTTWETIYGTSTVYQPIEQSPVATSSCSDSSTSVVDVASVPIATTTTTTTLTTSIVPADQGPTLATPATQYTTPAVFVQQTTPITTAAALTTPIAVAPVQPTTLVTQTTPILEQATATPNTAAAVSGGQCQGQGSACTGDVTHWDGGMGACGWNVNTASEMQVSLPVGLMGSQSNGNPYCGRSVSIKSTSGSIIQAKVGDKCMGCTGTSIDLTDALFSAVTDGKGDGRVAGVSWWFN